VDALLISHPINVTYLTGFSGDSSVLILTRDRAIVVSDFRYLTQLAEECPDLETVIRPTAQKLPEAIAQTLSNLDLRSVGFESNAMTVAELQTLRDLTPSLDWNPGTERVEHLRLIKDDSEIAAIREAVAMAEQAFIAFRATLRLNDTEKDLVDAMEAYARRVGGKSTAFPPIVAVAERAALPHAQPTDRTVGSGELLLVDWGVNGPFYKSDLTRTLAMRTISSKLYEVYTVVLNAQQQAIQAIRPGVPAHVVDAEARGVIAQAGFGSHFGHGLGHGIGLQIHEGPALRPGSETLLQPGMIVTVEPGIYLSGWGGVRIEDDVLVTPDGCEVLSRLPRDLEVLFA
jgi:Xaa-Pro aminopeptidase